MAEALSNARDFFEKARSLIAVKLAVDLSEITQWRSPPQKAATKFRADILRTSQGESDLVESILEKGLC